MSAQRTVWFTDTNGAEVEGEVSPERLDHLLAALGDAEAEHATVSVTDSEEWNLELGAGSVLFENVGPEGEEVGTLRLVGDDKVRAIVREFIAGDFAALRARPWEP